MNASGRNSAPALFAAVLLLGIALPGAPLGSPTLAHPVPSAAQDSAVGNFSAALQRLVTLLGISGSALLAIVWARVALSWFSNDLSKKIQAKDRARDALIGTLLFTAAFTGLAWGLARWVLTGT